MRNRNKARDRRRLKFPKKRRGRVFSPALTHIENDDPVKPEVRQLARWEMDAIRGVEYWKQCGRCGEIKETQSSFHRDNREPDGWYWKCKECRRKRV
jgi:hypothetical protein